jgi:hypothetical protein
MKRDPSSERDDIQEGLAERDAEQRDADREVAKDIARAFGADLDGGRDDEERRNWGDWLDARNGWLDDDFDFHVMCEAEQRSADFDRYYYEVYRPVFERDDHDQ